jgi:hypothetical protein
MGWSILTTNKKGTVPYMDRLPTRKIPKRPNREKLPGRSTDSPVPENPAKTESKVPTKLYEPTPAERASVDAYVARRKRKPPSPRVMVSKKGRVAAISLDHPEPSIGHILLAQAFGTTEPDFVIGLLNQLANASSRGGEANESGLNFMLSVVKSIAPKDEVEAMLAAQMAALHAATMTFSRRLANVDNIPQQDSAERAFNKLARTFASQVEALKRYRTGGEQKVTVQHVTVSDNAQAIVGNVSTEVGGNKKE